jgi:hypothetical protein
MVGELRDRVRSCVGDGAGRILDVAVTVAGDSVCEVGVLAAGVSMHPDRSAIPTVAIVARHSATMARRGTGFRLGRWCHCTTDFVLDNFYVQPAIYRCR